ncbi:hypothetical protein WME89_27500 [Sorangium sp. So ce321]|uniref:hypothetical protein n=1 Tax=Sorangium sp. So ce321 TaxID=3133300 RepID=UPI003F618E04
MNTRRILLVIVAIAVWVLSACNWTVGDCYPREEWEKGEGAGGPVGPPVPVFSSSASGDFGAEPPEGPQDGKKEKIQCNKTEDEDEDEEESPSDSSETPTASPTSPPDPCQQSGAPTMGCAGSRFKPSDFNFVTIVAYDGTIAGGWQEARTGLTFYEGDGGKQACFVRIGMPLRSEFFGDISADDAATISANVANAVTTKLENSGGFDLPFGIFCSRIKRDMGEVFDKHYKGLGAKMMDP